MLKVRNLSELLLYLSISLLMRLLGKNKLTKYKRKTRGNKPLADAIDKLIDEFDQNNWKNQLELKEHRPDADRIHSDGFYFFNLEVHRTMVLIEFDSQEATVVWVGSHQEYDSTFKNSKATIKKWLKSKGYI